MLEGLYSIFRANYFLYWTDVWCVVTCLGSNYTLWKKKMQQKSYIYEVYIGFIFTRINENIYAVLYYDRMEYERRW